MRAHVFPQLLFRSGYRLFIEKPMRFSCHSLRQDRNALLIVLGVAAGGEGIHYDPILQRLLAGGSDLKGYLFLLQQAKAI